MAKAKRTISATFEGTTVTTNTTRAYTHAVIGRRLDGRIEALAWSTSAKGAETLRRQHIGYMKPSHGSKGETLQKTIFGSAENFFVVAAD